MGQEDFGVLRKEYKCQICRDVGKVKKNGKIVDCECKRNKIPELVDEVTFEGKIDKYVPEQYRGITYDTKLVLNSNTIPALYKKNNETINFLNTMQKLYSKFVVGEKLNYSLFISAPQNMGKNHLVYSCLEASLKIGRTVAPYLDSLEIHGLLYRYKEADMGILDELIKADVCFIKQSTGLSTLASNIEAIKIITDRRTRNGLPTVVVSRLNLYYLTVIDPNITNFIMKGNYEGTRVDYARLRTIEAPSLYKKSEKNYNTKKNWS